MDIKTFGKFLADLRKEKQLTQQEVADALYVNVKTISKWETCRGYPDVEKFPAIANYFSISIDELINCKKDIKFVNDQQRIEKLKVVNEEQKKEIELFKKAINKKENIITATVIMLIVVIIIGTFAILINYFFKQQDKQQDKSLLSTQLYVENLNFTCDNKDPYVFETVYDGKMKIFDIHIYSIKEDKYINNEDIDGQDINNFVNISYIINNDTNIIEVNNSNAWPKNVGEYTFYIKFSPIKIYTESMITIKLKISYFVTDLTDINAENTLILTEKLKQTVKYQASATGNYIFSTEGSAKNSIESNKGTVTDIGNNITQLEIYLSKNEVIDFLVIKDKFLSEVSIKVEFKPEKIQINDKKTFSLNPNQELFFIYYSRGIEDSFDFAVLSNNTINISIYGSSNYNFNKDMNDLLEGNGNNRILKNNGSILASNYHKAYYIHIQNNTENEVCDVELSLNEIEGVSFEIKKDLNNTLELEKELNFNNKKVMSITTQFRTNLNFSIKSEKTYVLSLYDENGSYLSGGKDFIFFLEKDVKYYLQILHYSFSTVLEIKNIPLELEYGQNNLSSVYNSHLMLYEHTAVTANYCISSTVNVKIYDTNLLPLLAVEDNIFTFELGSKYFFIADLIENVNFTVEIIIDYTENLSGNLDVNGVKFIKFTPLRTGNYEVKGEEQYSWYTANYLNMTSYYLYRNNSYYLKIIGIPLREYDIEIVLVRNEIKLESTSSIAPGHKYFVAPHDGVYSFKTGVGNLTTSELIIYDQFDNSISGIICVDKEKYSIYLPKGTYNITLIANRQDARINVWITTEEDFQRTKIPIAPFPAVVSVERSTGTYYIIIEESDNYSFKTFRNSDKVTSNISLYGKDGTYYLENICTDLKPNEVYLEKGTYYLNLNISPYNSTVNIRVRQLSL